MSAKFSPLKLLTLILYLLAASAAIGLMMSAVSAATAQGRRGLFLMIVLLGSAEVVQSMSLAPATGRLARSAASLLLAAGVFCLLVAVYMAYSWIGAG